MMSIKCWTIELDFILYMDENVLDSELQWKGAGCYEWIHDDLKFY